jgi:hypothetical protein
MAMKKVPPPENPDAYVAALDGWRRDLVERLRRIARESGAREGIKWGHLVYATAGPVMLIRAEETRVLFGFWRGKRMRDLEPGLKGDGKYELGTLDLREGDTIADGHARALVAEAMRLDAELGDATRRSG